MVAIIEAAVKEELGLVLFAIAHREQGQMNPLRFAVFVLHFGGGNQRGKLCSVKATNHEVDLGRKLLDLQEGSEMCLVKDAVADAQEFLESFLLNEIAPLVPNP